MALGGLGLVAADLENALRVCPIPWRPLSCGTSHSSEVTRYNRLGPTVEARPAGSWPRPRTGHFSWTGP